MTQAQTYIGQLKRPKLLVQAARIGLKEYNRNKTLRRVLCTESLPKPGGALTELMREEDAVDSVRREGGAAYSPARHIELLAALMTEVQLASADLN